MMNKKKSGSFPYEKEAAFIIYKERNYSLLNCYIEYHCIEVTADDIVSWCIDNSDWQAILFA